MFMNCSSLLFFKQYKKGNHTINKNKINNSNDIKNSKEKKEIKKINFSRY